MNDLAEEFEILLNDKSKNENDIQCFLEDNSELIPLPFLAGQVEVLKNRIQKKELKCLIKKILVKYKLRHLIA